MLKGLRTRMRSHACKKSRERDEHFLSYLNARRREFYSPQDAPARKAPRFAPRREAGVLTPEETSAKLTLAQNELRKVNARVEATRGTPD